MLMSQGNLTCNTGRLPNLDLRGHRDRKKRRALEVQMKNETKEEMTTHTHQTAHTKEKQNHVKSTYSYQTLIRYDPRAMRGLLARGTCSPFRKSTRREALCAPLHSVLHYRRSASRSEFGRH